MSRMFKKISDEIALSPAFPWFPNVAKASRMASTLLQIAKRSISRTAMSKLMMYLNLTCPFEGATPGNWGLGLQV